MCSARWPFWSSSLTWAPSQMAICKAMACGKFPPQGIPLGACRGCPRLFRGAPVAPRSACGSKRFKVFKFVASTGDEYAANRKHLAWGGTHLP
eukprot:1181389-Prorocentrum_minimum.AAC.4